MDRIKKKMWNSSGIWESETMLRRRATNYRKHCCDENISQLLRENVFEEACYVACM